MHSFIFLVWTGLAVVWASSLEFSSPHSPIGLAIRASPVSEDGNCGSSSSTNATCLGSTYGDCCSAKGFCGSQAVYCGSGCNSAFGTCTDTSPGQTISSSGTCGSVDNSLVTCKGSTFGDCCSAKGFCGGTSEYCGTGCQSGFGTCGNDASTPSSTQTTASSAIATSATNTPSSASAAPISIDGNCGSNSDIKATCLSSTFGDCCSALGFCGGNSSYCAAGCQRSFGTCGSATTNTTAISSTSAPKPTQTFLGTGAKAGIGIGAAAFVLGVVALLVWYVRGRKKTPGVVANEEVGRLGGSQADEFPSPQMMTSPITLLPKAAAVYEIGGPPAFEMDATERSTAELASDEKRRSEKMDVKVPPEYQSYDSTFRGD